MLFDYDDRDIISIFNYAKKLENLTFRDIARMFCESDKKYYVNLYDNQHNYHQLKNIMVKETKDSYITNTKAKGQLGGLIERKYFGYEPNSNQSADFSKVGLELKLTCIDLTKKGEYRAGERLSITNISFKDPVIENFYESHVWNKIKSILLIHYIRDKTIDRMDYHIKFVNLFTPPQEDLEIIIQDYKKINEKIKLGKAHELSESDTLYLGACTKGSTSKDVTQKQYYGDFPAKRRNFCFKQSYMNYVLQNYILKNKVSHESIVKNTEILRRQSFEDYILTKINDNIGKTDKELCQIYNREYNNNKAQWNDLAFRMLGIKGNHVAEFEKANIAVKTIRIEENGKNKENMSFACFKFKDLLQEEWEDSNVHNYFSTTQILFVIFKRVGSSYVLKGSQLWHMPYFDLNETVKKEWENFKKIINNGITFKKVKKSNEEVEIYNNLPGMKDTQIIHIRPHAKKSAYKLKDGFIKGNIEQDADELPNGEWMTKQSFWLNKEYILKQLIIK